ncbi:hypothetical protein [Mediterraneibacter gnavus]|uniref:Hydrolase n=1 Tax=Mediterraneibacter gnavus TaxID=33038 RepID=A0AAJ1B3F0_MEDGN|nr:hypothetical protein [Mediterraneibacter gnavus]MCB5496022.1 hypothetical protein [Mediterraneibacter gnavus]
MEKKAIFLDVDGTLVANHGKMTEQVKKAMDDLAELKEISYSRLNTDYDFTDTAKKKYRYQAVYDIGFY